MDALDYKQDSLCGVHHMGNLDYKWAQSSVHLKMGTELCYSCGMSRMPYNT